MTTLNEQVIQDALWARQDALSHVTEFARKGWIDRVCGNIWTASSWMFKAALTEWHSGTTDPSSYIRLAIEDAERVLPYLQHLTQDALNSWSAAMQVIWQAMYGQLLLDEPISAEFRSAIDIPPSERREPERWSDYWVHPCESLMLQLADSGSVGEDWSYFISWLGKRRRAGMPERLKTMTVYESLLSAAHSNDREAAEHAVRRAEELFERRTPAGGGANWGDSAVNQRSVDYRLACMIKRAERLQSGITQQITTRHRWRW